MSNKDLVEELFSMKFYDLLFKAHTVHRENFDPHEIQLSSLLNIKTGACPENCSYCPQSSHYKTATEAKPLMTTQEVVEAAKKAKEAGASRFCLGAAWRSPRNRDIEKVSEMIKEIKKLGMESCVTLGMLNQEQAKSLKEAGLDFYNHNIDTSPEYYKEIITTRTMDDRLKTLGHVADADLQVCCGGILGMGETREDRMEMLRTLLSLKKHPESIPINQLIRVPGTPLEHKEKFDSFEFIRTIAVARILFPKSRVRVSAGRTEMTDECQALCFFAGANSMFIGDVLLVTENPSLEKDRALLERLDLYGSACPAEM